MIVAVYFYLFSLSYFFSSIEIIFRNTTYIHIIAQLKYPNSELGAPLVSLFGVDVTELIIDFRATFAWKTKVLWYQFTVFISILAVTQEKFKMLRLRARKKLAQYQILFWGMFVIRPLLLVNKKTLCGRFVINIKVYF